MNTDIKLVIFFSLTALLSIFLYKRLNNKTFLWLGLLSFIGVFHHFLDYYIKHVLVSSSVVKETSTRVSLILDFLIIFAALFIPFRKK
jgi:hypothetical protein